jgi:hypothetical protein
VQAMNHFNGIPRPEDARLQLWTVYDRSPDYPQHYVARLSLVNASDIANTEHLLVSSDLLAIRAQLLARGLHRIARHPDDQPLIVEVWL